MTHNQSDITLPRHSKLPNNLKKKVTLEIQIDADLMKHMFAHDDPVILTHE